MSSISRRDRAGFTLVELLTVVVIIGILLSLMTPAIQAARESARQAKCMNHQKELAKAVLLYEGSKKHFPGYVNQFGANPNRLSWVAVIFSDLGREDLWLQCRAGNIQPIRVDQLVCPSDLDWEAEPARLSYVANCGRDDTGDIPPDQPYNGVFHDHFSVPLAQQVRLSASDISDGTQQTLMLSEHITEAQWTDSTEPQVGFTWKVAPGKTILDRWRINDPDINPNTAPGSLPGVCASNHPGGMIVTFCDEHAYFLREDIDYRVLQHLMTPDSQKAWVQAGSGINVAGTLDEGDY